MWYIKSDKNGSYTKKTLYNLPSPPPPRPPDTKQNTNNYSYIPFPPRPSTNPSQTLPHLNHQSNLHTVFPLPPLHSFRAANSASGGACPGSHSQHSPPRSRCTCVVSSHKGWRAQVRRTVRMWVQVVCLRVTVVHIFLLFLGMGERERRRKGEGEEGGSNNPGRFV